MRLGRYRALIEQAYAASGLGQIAGSDQAMVSGTRRK
jgi:hypothetical protein